MGVVGTGVKYIIDPGNSTHLAKRTEYQTFVSTPAEPEGLSRQIGAFLHSGGYDNKRPFNITALCNGKLL